MPRGLDTLIAVGLPSRPPQLGADVGVHHTLECAHRGALIGTLSPGRIRICVLRNQCRQTSRCLPRNPGTLSLPFTGYTINDAYTPTGGPKGCDFIEEMGPLSAAIVLRCARPIFTHVWPLTSSKFFGYGLLLAPKPTHPTPCAPPPSTTHLSPSRH